MMTVVFNISPLEKTHSHTMKLKEKWFNRKVYKWVITVKDRTHSTVRVDLDVCLKLSYL